jgi:hypothetical protein
MRYQRGAMCRAAGLLLLNWARAETSLGLVSETESLLACLKLACARRTRTGEDMMGEVDGKGERTRGLFMRRADMPSANRLIGASCFCPLPLWPPTFGRVPTGPSPLSPPTTLPDSLPASKRWIVDRATLKQARAEDMCYVKDPLFFDLFNIFTGNRTAVPASRGTPKLTYAQ